MIDKPKELDVPDKQLCDLGDTNKGAEQESAAGLSVTLAVVARVALLAVWATIWTISEGREQNNFYFLDDIISDTKYYSFIKCIQFAFIIFQHRSLKKSLPNL